jgi:DNA-binding GntR family transcriptional regulator
MTSADAPWAADGDARPRNRGEEAYTRLRRAIVLGNMRPNERLVESELATALKVSRTPVREGLQRLAAEGLIRSVRRGWVVRELSLDEVREIYEVREALEGFAARLAAQRATLAHLRKLEQIIERRNRTPVPQRRRELVSTNDLFHQTVFRASGNERLCREIVRTSEYYFNMRVASLYTDEEMAASACQHSDLVEALRNHDRDRAEQITRDHVRDALAAILRHAV